MASPKKIAANRRNAKKSKGPNNTSKTRFNAVKHGILSKAAFITAGDGQEDRQEFDELNSSLRRHLAPSGPMEKLIVDEMTALVWRKRRIIKHETALIRSRTDTAIDDWSMCNRSDEDLANDGDSLKIDLRAMARSNPISARPEVWRSVFSTASEYFQVPIDRILNLEQPWDDQFSFSEPVVQSIIDHVCKKSKISEKEFWHVVIAAVRLRIKELARLRKKLRLEVDRITDSVCALHEEDMNPILRYEAANSRQFYRALRELQRLQAARLGGLLPPHSQLT